MLPDLKCVYPDETGQLGQHSLPDWAKFLIGLGAEAWKHASKKESGVRIALSLPTLSYASPLVAFGAVMTAMESVVHESVDAQFDTLAAMNGAKVALKVKKRGRLREIFGIIQGSVLMGADEYIKVLTKESDKPNAKVASASQLVPKEALDTIRLIDQATEINLGKEQVGYSLARNARFVSELLSNKAKATLYEKENPGIVIMDIKNRFIGECLEENFSVGNLTTGCLADILRPNCMPQYENTFTTTFQPSSGKEVFSDPASPWPLMILCGAAAVIRNFDNRHAHCIIGLLNRCDRENTSAEEAVNQSYSQRRGEIHLDVGSRSEAIKTTGFLR